MQQKKIVSIEQTIENCIKTGKKLPLQAKPFQSELKTITSQIGMAYLNYIYQNDLNNDHFCESMLYMNKQIPEGTKNPFVRLFERDMAEKTMPILEDIQLSFDYAIARTDPPIEKLKASIENIKSILH